MFFESIKKVMAKSDSVIETALATSTLYGHHYLQEAWGTLRPDGWVTRRPRQQTEVDGESLPINRLGLILNDQTIFRVNGWETGVLHEKR